MADDKNNTSAFQQQPVQIQPRFQKRAFPLKAAAAAVAVVIILAAAYVLLGSQSLPGSSGGSSALQAELSSPGNQTVAGVVGVTAGKLATLNELNVSYSGHALIGVKASSLGNIQFSVPFRLSFQKLGQNSRIYFNASGIPVLGNITTTEISLANGTSYSCTASSFLSGMSGAPSSQNAGKVTCQKSATSASAPTSIGSQFNLNISQLSSSLNSSGLKAMNGTKVKIAGQAQYLGQGCVLVLISGKVNQPNTTGDYNVSTCLSAQYYVPLNLTASASVSTASNGGYDVTVAVNETSIGGQVTLAGISALPGPVVNSTASQPQNLNSTGFNYT